MTGFGFGSLFRRLSRTPLRRVCQGDRKHLACWFFESRFSHSWQELLDDRTLHENGGSVPSDGDEKQFHRIFQSYGARHCPAHMEGVIRLHSSRGPYSLDFRRDLRTLTSADGSSWMRGFGAYGGPLIRHQGRDPFRDGSVRFKSKKKQKKAKQKKKEVLAKIKRIRVITKKRIDDMTPEELLEYKIRRGEKKIELTDQYIAKFPIQELPPVDPDIEVLTPEQLHYLKKIGYKNKNYVPVGRRGVYGGTIQNIHLHWKKHETVQVEIVGFTKEEVKEMAEQLARLSGGLVVDIHQGNTVILYRGRNYKQPKALIPMKTLDKRKKASRCKPGNTEEEVARTAKDIALGYAVGKDEALRPRHRPDGDEAPNCQGLGPADVSRLQDPDSYESPPGLDELSDEYDSDSDLDSFTDEEILTKNLLDSDEEETDSDVAGEVKHNYISDPEDSVPAIQNTGGAVQDELEDDSDPEDLGMPVRRKHRR